MDRKRSPIHRRQADSSEFIIMRFVARTAFTIVSMSAAGFVLAACGSDSQDEKADDPAAQAGASGEISSPSDIEEAFKFLKYDFSPVDNVADLRQGADLEISGTLTSVAYSRSDGEDYSALEVEDAGRTVWIELPVKTDSLREALNPGTKISAILEERRILDDLPSDDTGSGVPVDAEVFIPVHPQALVIQWGEGEGASVPLSESQYPSLTADEVLSEVPEPTS